MNFCYRTLALRPRVDPVLLNEAVTPNEVGHRDVIPFVVDREEVVSACGTNHCRGSRSPSLLAGAFRVGSMTLNEPLAAVIDKYLRIPPMNGRQVSVVKMERSAY